MTRRHFLQHSAALAGALLSGCDVGGKSHISRLGKTYDYLRDPALRQREQGEAQLVVRGVEFSGIRFQGEEWHNIRFVNCDFVGAYEIHPRLIAQSSFEGCKFAGIFNLGVLRHVRFERCLFDGSSHVGGDMGSEDVTFESCEQMGKNPDANHWGSFGAYGEAAFIKCKAKWTHLNGETKHLIRDCDFEQVACSIRDDGGGSEVLIENSRLLGAFNLRPATLRSLTVRDSTIGTLDFDGATVKGDILIERVKAERLIVDVEEGAGGFTLRDSQITGDGEHVFNTYAGAFRSILVENVSFGAALKYPVAIAGGYDLDDKRPQPRTLKSVTYRNVTVPWLKSSWLSTDVLLLENVQVGKVELQEGLIDSLEFNNLQVTKHIDLSKTLVKRFKQTGGTDLRQLGSGLKLEGSNIKLP